MSDRTILALASVPMVSGILLVAVLQRGQALREEEALPRSSREAAAHAQPVHPQPWLGVVAAGRAAELASEFEGRVTRVFVKAGARIKAGDAILQIDGRDASAAVGMADAEMLQRRSELSRAQARLDAARDKLQRMQAGKTWLSAQELESARAEVRVAEAELQSAQSMMSLGRARLRQQQVRAHKHTLAAPFRGTVASIDVDPGDSVVPGRVLARVVSDDRHIKFAVPPGQLGESRFEKVWVRAEGMKQGLLARVNAVRPEVDPAAQLVFATASLPEDQPAAQWILGSEVEVLPARDSTTLGAFPKN